MTEPKSPRVGSFVFYRLETGPSRGSYRPAFVVRTFGPSTTANLFVMTDGTGDKAEVAESLKLPTGQRYTHMTQWATSRIHGHEIGQWLWPDDELFTVA